MRLQKAEAKEAAGGPSRPRQNVPWSVEEENMLAQAVEPYLQAASIDYSSIHSRHFAHRTKREVMAKWENMCRAQKRLTGQKRRR